MTETLDPAQPIDSECACTDCVALCESGVPGWFLPGEAERAAELLGMDLQTFYKRFLVTDYAYGEDYESEVEVLAPFGEINARAMGLDPEQDREIVESLGESDAPGCRVTFSYPFAKRRCVFLSAEGRCRIHAAKPAECRWARACASGPSSGRRHRDIIADAWRAARGPERR